MLFALSTDGYLVGERHDRRRLQGVVERVKKADVAGEEEAGATGTELGPAAEVSMIADMSGEAMNLSGGGEGRRYC